MRKNYPRELTGITAYVNVVNGACTWAALVVGEKNCIATVAEDRLKIVTVKQKSMDTIKDVINDTEDLPLVLDCIDREIKRCRGIADRAIQGYGRLDEITKKEKWNDRANQLEVIKTNISYAYL